VPFWTILGCVTELQLALWICDTCKASSFLKCLCSCPDSCFAVTLCYREALTREITETEKLKREMHRLLAEVALNKMESEQEVGGILARNERLQAEVTETRVHLEVLKAKGSMYDEVDQITEKHSYIRYLRDIYIQLYLMSK
jgi:hypothetical protein